LDLGNKRRVESEGKREGEKRTSQSEIAKLPDAMRSSELSVSGSAALEK
jgi:hypothetical protein